MKVIVIASQKGGVGKTTLAGHLAVQAETAGAGPVALIDTDPQGSLAAWWNERQAEAPLFAQAGTDNLPQHLAELEAAGVQLVVIDTPPAVTDTIRKVLAVADLVVIPTRPSPHDLRAVGSTVDLVEAAGRRMIFVINGAANRARIAGEAAVALSQHGTVAPVTLYQRTDYASSMIDGRTVQEIDAEGRSAQEISDLWRYVETQLRKSVNMEIRRAA
ncbi:MAG: ParA family protein [Betaproteobacteria bacterium]|nr:ParA family protein [Betaproteobacteria bacterium]